MSDSNRVVFIRGKKTVLRPLMETDLPLVIRWINDPEVRQYVSNWLPQNEENERQWIKKQADDRSNLVFMVEDSEGKPFGLMGLHRINLKDRNAVTGAVFGEKSYWGKGYGTDAKLHLLEYAFNELGLHRVSSLVIGYNERSLRYSLRCGYKVEGRQKDMVYKGGRFWDHILLVIFKGDFEKVWQLYSETGEVR